VDVLRIVRILIRPHEVWEEIAHDEDTFSHVLTHYVIPLALIPAVFGFFGQVLVGMPSSYSHVIYRSPLGLAFARMILYYLFLVTGLYLEGIVINALAPPFHSKQDALRAFKLAVFSYIPAFFTGLLRLVPVLGLPAFVLSLYSVFLLYRGIPVMMETPKHKVISYTIVVVVIMVLIYLIIGGISLMILGPVWRAR
jgi:hypothetical protein